MYNPVFTTYFMHGTLAVNAITRSALKNLGCLRIYGLKHAISKDVIVILGR